MRTKVEHFIRNCLSCILHSVPRSIHNRTLHSIPKPCIPFHTLHIDHLGPLPSIISKRKHLLVVIDAFIKFVKLFPVNTTSTREARDALSKYFDFYSRPHRIISDRGTCFTSLEFTTFCQERDTGAPQANGQVERVNRVLTPMLGKLAEPLSQSDWYKLLDKVEYAINNAVHSSTQVAPSVLLFGVVQKGPVVDELSEYLENKFNDEPRDLVSICENASVNIQNSQIRNEESYSRKHKAPREYQVGDYVAIRNVDTTAGINKKFAPKYRGPYRISRVFDNDRYEVVDIDDCQLTQLPFRGVLEPARLKPWISNVNELVALCL
ncbi:uncharacterized protein LOC120320788 [Drosophila yakuba]|uniref:uncharacterized protein LOC120320788 n=1 Tax=Drosophila yakuba TaxID=7245 RepID=UPI0019307493|nr:uncharacterized protein LOC120320788 [Drosophila yakuba]